MIENLENPLEVCKRYASPSFFSLSNIIQKWGCAPSLALLNPSCRIFKIDGVEGVIGYRIESRCAIVFGDPLCAAENRILLINAFQKFCSNEKIMPIY
jgi:hypothetical protein